MLLFTNKRLQVRNTGYRKHSLILQNCWVSPPRQRVSAFLLPQGRDAPLPSPITAPAADPIARETSSEERKPKCSLSGGEHLCAKDGTCLLKQWEPTLASASSKIQLQITESFASALKMQLKSQPCHRLPGALPVLTCLGEEVGSGTHRSVLKWTLCNGTDRRKPG